MNYTLITGASKGIGKAFAHECAKRGMNLILVARSETLLNTLAQELSSKNIGVKTYVADLFEADAHKKIFDWVEQNKLSVNMLINNAGMGHYGKFNREALDKHLQVMHLNMDAMVTMAHEFLNRTDGTQKRYLLNTSSTGAFQPVPNMAVYCATKAFILSFTRALRYELRKDNVNVTSLCPGGTETDFFTPAKMESVIEKNAQFMMTADKVAMQGLNGLISNQAVVIPGFINKVGAYAARYAPQGLVVAQAAQFFKE